MDAKQNLRDAVRDAHANHRIKGVNNMVRWLQSLCQREPHRRDLWRTLDQTGGKHWLSALVKTIVDEDRLFDTRHGGSHLRVPDDGPHAAVVECIEDLVDENPETDTEALVAQAQSMVCTTWRAPGLQAVVAECCRSYRLRGDIDDPAVNSLVALLITRVVVESRFIADIRHLSTYPLQMVQCYLDLRGLEKHVTHHA